MENKKLKQIYCNIKEITKEAINKLEKHTYGSVSSILYAKLTSHMENLKTNPRNFAAAYKGIIDTINDIEKPLMDHNDFSNLMTKLEGNYKSILDKLSPEAVETLEAIITSKEDDVPSEVKDPKPISEAKSYLNKRNIFWGKWARAFDIVGFGYRNKNGTPSTGMAKDYGKKHLMDKSRQKITFPTRKFRGRYFKWERHFTDEDILEIASIVKKR